MATNADEQGADNTDQDAEDILRSSKYPKDDVETSEEEDEPTEGEDTEEESEADSEDDGQTDDEAEGDKDSEEESKEDDSEEEDLFVKKFPNIKGENLPEYTKTLEEAYDNSTSEAMKWKKRAEEAEAKLGDNGDEGKDKGDSPEVDTADPLKMWAQQNLDKEVSEAYDDFVKIYPQATEETNYEKFKEEVATLSQTILNRQKRLASPRELYTKAAVILGWEPTETKPTKGERLKSAIKDGAAIPRTTGGTKKRPKSKVTEGQIAVYRKMNPNSDKSDADIRQELEEYT